MTQNYIEENKKRFLEELMDLLTIPSVSADLSFKNDVLKAAKFLSKNLEQIGVENVEIYPTSGHPIVYGEKIISTDVDDESCSFAFATHGYFRPSCIQPDLQNRSFRSSKRTLC